MDSEILYKRICTGFRENTYLEYYIIPESISAAYCDLKCYGIKVVETTIYEGGGKTIDIKQINNVFYREQDAADFAESAAKKQIRPPELRTYMENYILEGLDRAKQKA